MGATQILASGVSHLLGINWNPAAKIICVAVERYDLAPEYTTSVKRDGFYGWPL